MNTNLPKVGHPTQLYRVEEMRLVGGKGDNMRMLQLNNGGGLQLTLLPDRCLDPARLEYKGYNLGFFSPCGYVAPAYYDKEDFLRSFNAGFMTTCGLKNAGASSVDEGEDCVTHGRISNTPCENLTYQANYDEDNGEITVSGTMNEAILFNEKLQLCREVTMKGNVIEFHDTVKNLGGETQPLMLLYHVNLGYPLLDSCLDLMIPAHSTKARDPRAQEGIDNWREFPEPEAGFAEQCYYHDIAEVDGVKSVAAYNPKIGVGVRMDWSADTLDSFTQWKMCGVRDYVLGIEPSNCHVEGRDKMRADGRLKFIAPFESISYTLRFTVFEGDEQAEAVRKELMSRI
jgi:hypothetical protein